MNMDEFNQLFQNDPEIRSKLTDTIVQKMNDLGVPPDDATVTLADDDDGNPVLLIDPNMENEAFNKQLAEVAIQALETHGVTDFTGVKGLSNNKDKLALNVVYKNGGWVVNTKPGQNFGKASFGGKGGLGNGG
ncbi:hypothetical protein [Pseudomonas sp. CMR5c]|uniref:hypothetical protein n=1 Tax=Pseudomonas sp. CMR5c TaxID=658630 RepID=UPI000F55A748|nr:hypothetical protein [Pseudomonas sp. CMR5c]